MPICTRGLTIDQIEHLKPYATNIEKLPGKYFILHDKYWRNIILENNFGVSKIEVQLQDIHKENPDTKVLLVRKDSYRAFLTSYGEILLSPFPSLEIYKRSDIGSVIFHYTSTKTQNYWAR